MYDTRAALPLTAQLAPIREDKLGFMGQRQRTRRQQQRALLTKNGTTITRDNGSVAYMIYCAKCDYQNFAINAGGRMSYKQALILANKHFCNTLNFNEDQA